MHRKSLKPAPTATSPSELDPLLTGGQAESLEQTLERLIVGQPEAIAQIVNMYQMYVAGLNAPSRPVANFLFLGPTGTGKTRVVEATAAALTGNPRALIKIDCAEFQHSHEIAKLVGSPPGYLGHRETHPLLSQEMLNQHQTEGNRLSFVLFDEVEKASDSLWNLLLGVLDKGVLTLGDNRKVDFSRTMIFLTSNLGAAEMSSLLHPKVGFRLAPSTELGASTGMAEKLKRTGTEAARRKFTPEFLNRLDKVVVFQPLAAPSLERILDLEIAQVQDRIFASPAGHAFALAVDSAARRALLDEGLDPRYGARHLKRTLERRLVQPLANLIASGQIHAGDLITVHHSTEGFRFQRTQEGLTRAELAGFGLPPLEIPHPAATAAALFAAARPAGLRPSRRV